MNGEVVLKLVPLKIRSMLRSRPRPGCELIAKLTVRYVLANSKSSGLLHWIYVGKEESRRGFSLRHFLEAKDITTGPKNDGDDRETEFRLLATHALVNCQ
jgi:hypothetical protein